MRSLTYCTLVGTPTTQYSTSLLARVIARCNIQKAPDKREECIRIAGELISQIKDMGMAGVLISAVGWEDKIPQILDRAKL